TSEQAEDDQEERAGEGDEAPEVGPDGPLVSRLAHARERDPEGERPDRNVDEEHPAPAQSVGQDAADERSRGDCGADSRSPDRDRASSLGSSVLVTDQREGGREQRGAADALQRPRDVEGDDVPGETAEQRGAATLSAGFPPWRLIRWWVRRGAAKPRGRRGSRARRGGCLGGRPRGSRGSRGRVIRARPPGAARRGGVGGGTGVPPMLKKGP